MRKNNTEGEINIFQRFFSVILTDITKPTQGTEDRRVEKSIEKAVRKTHNLCHDLSKRRRFMIYYGF